MDANNLTKQGKNQAEDELKEKYLACIMMDGSDNSSFGNVKTNLENKITCGSESYPKSKDKNLERLNNYHVRK